MLQFGIIATSEFLYIITNHATDAINMKLGKLKRNNVRNTNKTRQLIINLSKKCSNCPL